MLPLSYKQQQSAYQPNHEVNVRFPWKSKAVWEKQENMKKVLLLKNTQHQCAETQESSEKTKTYYKEQLEYKVQINKIRNTVEDKLSQLAL